MKDELLHGGRPIVVTSPRDRIGHGPWSRLFATTVVGPEGSKIGERGRELARGGTVHDVRITAGRITASVTDAEGHDCDVTFSADPIPPRIWDAVSRSARVNPRLTAAIEGREQSVHLEHQMRYDWSEPLIPNLGRTCTCSNAVPCEHIAAVAYVIADLVDDDPALLLHWRGCDSVEGDAAIAEAHAPEPEPEPDAPVSLGDEPWQVGRLPAPRPLRALPAGAVLKCLGPSGLHAGSGDLADVLQRGYAAFSAAEGL